MDLWEPLTRFLIDPAVSRDQKAAALDRLATRPEACPASVRTAVTTNAGALLSASPFASPLDLPEIDPFPAGIRFLGSLGVLSAAELVVAVASFSSGDARSRLEAARTVAALAQSSAAVSDWLTFAGFQLSNDSDASVRAESGRALALAVHRSEFVRPAVLTRLQELLREDGIVVPLLVLRGLTGEELPEALLEAVRRLAEEHVIEGVRVQARYLLTRNEG